jgi:hypothetical protein
MTKPHKLATLALGLLLAACANVPGGGTADDPWHAVHLPGKEPTRYTRDTKEGRTAIAAVSVGSASMWRHKLDIAPEAVGEVSFSWWAPELLAAGNVADVALEDATARVLFGFGGDQSKLAPRTRMAFDLAEALTGERPPYATLMYVWDAKAPVGSVIVNPRSDRIRKIVLDSGPEGLRRWRDHRRDLVADFRLAFGEEPGPLRSMAIMTDSDNTRSQARTWYGEILLHPRPTAASPAPLPRANTAGAPGATP